MSHEVASLKGVAKDFPHQRVLHNVSFDIPRGSTTLISGPSGSGKSTSIRMIADLERPTEGEVQLFGQSMRQMNPKVLRKVVAEKVSFVQQDPALDGGLSVYENLLLTTQALRSKRRERAQIRERVGEVALMFGIAHLLDRQADMTLSGGEKAKVALARSLVKRPELLILDEPTSAVDPRGTTEIYSRLHEVGQREDLTIIMVSHDDEAARQIATREVIIDSGIVTDTVSY